MRGGGGWHARWWVCVTGGGICGRGVHGGGGHAWQRVCAAGGMHSRGACVAGGGAAWQERWPLQPAVRILLECILVYHKYCFHTTLAFTELTLDSFLSSSVLLL